MGDKGAAPPGATAPPHATKKATTMEEFNIMMCNEDIVRTITGTHVEFNKDYTLTQLANMSVEELMKFKGIGKATAKKLLATFELGRRLLTEETYRNDLGSSLDLYNYLRPRMSHLESECAYLVVMNQNFKELKTVKISDGGVTNCYMDVRAIIRHTIGCNGTVIAVAHNHPSNSVTPSKNDDLVTKKIADACNMMDIYFMDHIIIGDRNFYSYHDKGRL